METRRKYIKQYFPLYERISRSNRRNEWFFQKNGVWNYRKSKTKMENFIENRNKDVHRKEWFINPTKDCVYYNRYTTPWSENYNKNRQIWQMINGKRVKTAGILLKDKYSDYFVLVQNYGSSWSVPKGSIERDETVFDAAVREFKEETGIEDITVDKSTKYIVNKDVIIFLVKKDFSTFSIQSNLDSIDSEITAIGKMSINCIKEIDDMGLIEKKVTTWAIGTMIN